MRTVRFFLASSVVEFAAQRQELGDFILSLNQSVYHRRGITLEWNKPENTSGALALDGLQENYNQLIRESRFFFLIAGKRLGKYTVEEFDAALERFRATKREPKIFPWFYLGGQMPDESTYAFWNRLREMGHYPKNFTDWNALKLELVIEIGRELATATPEEADAQKDADRALGRIAERIRENTAKIDKLKERGLTLNDTIPKIVELYEENLRLVKRYHVEPDAAYWYAGFLWKQNAFREAIELLDWLGNLYAANNAAPEAEARRLNLVGACYYGSHQYPQAEAAFREALDTCRKLVKDNPAAFLPDLAKVCNNLGLLLSDTNRMEEAETFFRETLDTYRKLARDNPSAFLPDLAASCNNLGLLLYSTNRMEEAETFYREALDTYRKLARDNPDAFLKELAASCNNLGGLLSDTNRMEEAETFYREALDIRRKLARDNPAAFLPDLTGICYNLGILLSDTNRMEEAETFYREALDIRRKLARDNPSAFLPDLAASCNDLGGLLYSTNRMEEAETFYREALGIRRKLARDNPAAFLSDLAASFNDLGLLLTDTGRTAEAEPLCTEALEIDCKLAEDNPDAYEIDSAYDRVTMANLLAQTSRRERAEALYREALSIFGKYPGHEWEIETARKKMSPYFPHI